MRAAPVILLLGVLLLGAWGCSKSHARPKGALEDKKMGAILWDLVRADEYVTNYLLKDSTLKIPQERMRLYQRVLALHRVTQAQFQLTYQYYMDHPEVGLVVLDSVTAKANRERSDAYRYKGKPVSPP